MFNQTSLKTDYIQSILKNDIKPSMSIEDLFYDLEVLVIQRRRGEEGLIELAAYEAISDKYHELVRVSDPIQR